MGIVRVFTELTPEVDLTAQLYAKGKEKKEIAQIKYRSPATINTQLQTAFEGLAIRNGRELSILYAERVTKTIIAIFFLSIICIDIYQEASDFYRRPERIELCARRKGKKQDDSLDLEPLLI